MSSKKSSNGSGEGSPSAESKRSRRGPVLWLAAVATCGLLLFALLRGGLLNGNATDGLATGLAVERDNSKVAALDGLFPLSNAEPRLDSPTAGKPGMPGPVIEGRVSPADASRTRLPQPAATVASGGDPEAARQRSAEDARREADLQARQQALDLAAAAQEQHAKELTAQQATLVAAAREAHDRDAERTRREEVAALEAARKPKPYSGPASGSIVWEGTVQGEDLITISGGTSDVGTVTSGSLPGVTVLISPVDTKHVRIASAPAPSNGFKRVVIGTSGKGAMKIILHWSLP